MTMDATQAKDLGARLRRAVAKRDGVEELEGSDARDFVFVADRKVLVGSFKVNVAGSQPFFASIVSGGNDADKYQLLVMEKLKGSPMLATSAYDGTTLRWRYIPTKQDGDNAKRKAEFVRLSGGTDTIALPLPDENIRPFATAVVNALKLRHQADDAGGEAATGDDVLAKIKHRVEKALPDVGVRKAVLELMAYTIETVDEADPGCWYVRERSSRGLALFAARLFAFGFTASKLEMSVMGPLDDAVRQELGADTRDDEAFKAVPGALILTFDLTKAEDALRLLREPFDRFIDEALIHVRRKMSLEAHVPEAVTYVASVVGRELPQPVEVAASAVEENGESEDDPLANKKPKTRGRAPIFNHAQVKITDLLGDIEGKKMALPDLQRPFVWEDTKVRDLLDSLFVGFPVGTIVLWQTLDDREARAIGGPDVLRVNTLIIDGQQRLTSLFAVMRGADVIDADGAKRKIKIAFRPRDGRFAVHDAAIQNDPEFIPNVTELWTGPRMKGQIRRDLLQALRARPKNPEVSQEYENALEENLDRAHAINDYLFPVVRIQKAAGRYEATEEDVAEIFVRINNQGKRLGQADFVLTLLSVFHGPLRDKIETNALEMSQADVAEIDTQQLLRVVCAVGFYRARMSAIYRFLRGAGADAHTPDMSPDARRERLEALERAANECMQPTVWRDYKLRAVHAGFVNRNLIASNNAFVNAYAFYVLGRRVGLAKPELDDLIARWLYGSLLTARYSGSSETIFEEDLARVAAFQPGDGTKFAAALDTALAENITDDYWTHTLVSQLETQRGRAPAALAFRAAQIVLGAHALFSDQPLQNLFIASGKATRSASEVHHLFPKAWLATHGVKEKKRINQVANYADVGWYENNVIGARSPSDYVPRLRESLRIDDHQWGRACAEHALPLGWEQMDYDTFLRARRARMADLIRVAYRQLGGEATVAPIVPPWFLPGAEVVWQRIAEVERALRAIVRETYGKRYGDRAAQKIEETFPPDQRETLTRALRARPADAAPLSVVDYLYLSQLPVLLFASEIWQDARAHFGGREDAKQRVNAAMQIIMPVRNEIAHVREILPERLQKANIACSDVLAMVKT